MTKQNIDVAIYSTTSIKKIPITFHRGVEDTKIKQSETPQAKDKQWSSPRGTPPMPATRTSTCSRCPCKSPRWQLHPASWRTPNWMERYLRLNHLQEGTSHHLKLQIGMSDNTQIAKFMRPTWGPPGSCRSQMGPMLAPWTCYQGSSLQCNGSCHSLSTCGKMALYPKTNTASCLVPLQEGPAPGTFLHFSRCGKKYWTTTVLLMSFIWTSYDALTQSSTSVYWRKLKFVICQIRFCSESTDSSRERDGSIYPIYNPKKTDRPNVIITYVHTKPKPMMQSVRQDGWD